MDFLHPSASNFSHKAFPITLDVIIQAVVQDGSVGQKCLMLAHLQENCLELLDESGIQRLCELLETLLESESAPNSIKGQVISTVTSVFIQMELRTSKPATFASFVDLLVDQVCSEEPQDCALRSTMCSCMHELEATYPGVLAEHIPSLLDILPRNEGFLSETLAPLLILALKNTNQSALQVFDTLSEEHLSMFDPWSTHALLSALVDTDAVANAQRLIARCQASTIPFQRQSAIGFAIRCSELKPSFVDIIADCHNFTLPPHYRLVDELILREACIGNLHTWTAPAWALYPTLPEPLALFEARLYALCAAWSKASEPDEALVRSMLEIVERFYEQECCGGDGRATDVLLTVLFSLLQTMPKFFTTLFKFLMRALTEHPAVVRKVANQLQLEGSNAFLPPLVRSLKRNSKSPAAESTSGAEDDEADGEELKDRLLSALELYVAKFKHHVVLSDFCPLVMALLKYPRTDLNGIMEAVLCMAQTAHATRGAIALTEESEQILAIAHGLLVHPRRNEVRPTIGAFFQELSKLVGNGFKTQLRLCVQLLNMKDSKITQVLKPQSVARPQLSSGEPIQSPHLFFAMECDSCPAYATPATSPSEHSTAIPNLQSHITSFLQRKDPLPIQATIRITRQPPTDTTNLFGVTLSFGTTRHVSPLPNVCVLEVPRSGSPTRPEASFGLSLILSKPLPAVIQPVAMWSCEDGTVGGEQPQPILLPFDDLLLSPYHLIPKDAEQHVFDELFEGLWENKICWDSQEEGSVEVVQTMKALNLAFQSACDAAAIHFPKGSILSPPATKETGSPVLNIFTLLPPWHFLLIRLVPSEDGQAVAWVKTDQPIILPYLDSFLSHVFSPR